MAIEFKITGAPGAGKTERLRSGVERYVERGEYDPDEIVLTSFTRAAAAVLRGRIEVPHENVATLHSLARRTIGGSPPIAEVGALAKQWNESGIPAQWRVGKPVASEEDGLAVVDESGDVLAEYSLARSKMLPASHPVWTRLRGFGERWEAFKRETGSVDFTDMISLALTETDACYGEPPVIIVDEAQDLVPLQWALVRRWAAHWTVERFIVAGDPAQVLYGFAGARPDEFLGGEGSREMLPRSHRLPRAIATYAERLLRLHSGGLTDGREYQPREEEGTVRRLGATWRDPDVIVAQAAAIAAEGRTVAILATCSYMLEPTVRELRDRGLLFHNPYRSNGRWNPLGAPREGTVRTLDRVRAFTEARDPHLWLPLLRASAYAQRGGKKHAEAEPLTWREWATGECIAAVEAGDLRWLQANAMKETQSALGYAAALLRRGPLDADTEPRIVIGTGHSIKGGECDVTFLLPDVSQAGAAEMAAGPTGRDAAVRLAYVMATRARDTLVICAPSGRDALEV